MADETTSWIDERLEELRAEDLERRLTCYPEAGGRIRLEGRTYLNFASNDYLDLARAPTVVEAAARALRDYGAGATASRLLTGTLPPHAALEEAMAAYKGYPHCLVFGSGYMTNAGTIGTLVGRGDHVFADRLVHASVIDAVLLSRAQLHRFRHNDAGHLEKILGKAPADGRRLVVTESVFSMDGDIAPLPEIVSAAKQHGAMVMVDEAHATGVFGPKGSGLVREHGLESSVDVSMGTLSKALGGYGGFVACAQPVRDLLVNRARAFIYTTAPPPAAMGAALGSLAMLQADPEMGTRLLERAGRLVTMLHAEGLDTFDTASQIIPVRIGDNGKAVALARRLRDEGIIAPAIRPPTVPAGEARLRLSLTLAHTDEDIERVCTAIGQAAREEGILT